MNSKASRAAAEPSPSQPPAGPSVAEREVRLTSLLVVGALLVGLLLQVWIPPGGFTLVAAAFLASMVLIAVGYLAPGKLRQTIAGFRFIATLLFVLAVEAILGTLVLQMKPTSFYVERYGVAGKVIVALRLDDVFHGLPFALLMALFGAAVIASALLRWPVKVKNLGFFIAHIGLLTSLAGAGASATLSIRGRIDLHAGGETATHVVLKRGKQLLPERAALGFDLHLDRFELVNYEPEFRIGFYEQGTFTDEEGRQRPTWRLKASFDPDLQKHRLPSGDSFRLTGIYPEFQPVPDPVTRQVKYGTASQEWKSPAVAIEANAGGRKIEQLLLAAQPQAVFLGAERALLFEKREQEVKAYVSHVTAAKEGKRTSTKITVNEPMSFGGWTLYQVNYNPADPTYSGLEAVYDPGVAWVFLGFALICIGVFYMFYLEPRLKARG
ncbi:MAG TPA: cytochrome c biogenesis protein ResB [Anaeromyxobacter sp.]